MRVNRLNPKYRDASYEEIILDQFGRVIYNPFARRFTTLMDALAKENPIPQYIIEEE